MLRRALLCSLAIAVAAAGPAIARTPGPPGCVAGVRSVPLQAGSTGQRPLSIACLRRTGSRLRAGAIRGVPVFSADRGDWARYEVPVLEALLDAPVPAVPVDSDSARPSRAVAILALDRTAGGPEYQALQAIGVPAWITPSIAEAERAPLIILAGTLDYPTAAEIGPARLQSYTERGGVVIGEAVTALALADLFGFTTAPESSARREITFAGTSSLLAEIDTTEERHVDLRDAAQDTSIGTVGHAGGTATALALFDDGTRAVSVHAVGRGRAIAIGGRLLDLVDRHHEGARFPSRAAFANGGDTDADVWPLLLRAIWRSVEPGGITLATAPGGSHYAVIPTISANWGDGIAATPAYLRAIRAAGPVRTTVFVPTRYVEDWLDRGFWTDALFPTVRRIRRLGGDLGSQSVSHTPRFDALPPGSGSEDYTTYAPYVLGRGACIRPVRRCSVTHDASLLGELRVSRQLLLGVQSRVTSFRAPYLAASRPLAPAEDATGYRQDSSTTQGWVQGALPFHPPRLDGRGYTDVFSFPIAIEDEARPAFATRVAAARDVIRANGANGAPSVVLLHPNASAAKRAAVRALFGSLDAGAWVGSLDQFGAFWRQRSDLRLATGPAQSDEPGCDGAVRGFVIANAGDATARGQSLDVTAGDIAIVSDAAGATTTLPVENGRVALPDIAAGGSLRGQLCGAHRDGVDLAGSWQIDPAGLTVQFVPRAGDPTGTVYDGMLGSKRQLVLTIVAPGQVCVTLYDGPVWLECGPLAAGGGSIGSLLAHSATDTLAGIGYTLTRL